MALSKIPLENARFVVEWYNKLPDFHYGNSPTDNIWNIVLEPLRPQCVSHDNTAEIVVWDSYLPEGWAYTSKFVHKHYVDPSGTWRFMLHATYQRYIRWKSTVLRKVDRLFAASSPETFIIGAHVRSPIHADETFSGFQPGITDYFTEIDTVLRNNQNKKKVLFLATDNTESLKAFKDHYARNTSVQLLFQRHTLYSQNEDHHALGMATGNEQAMSVCIDAVALSRCHVVLGGVSNIITAVLYMNPTASFIYVQGNAGSARRDAVHNNPPTFVKRALTSQRGGCCVARTLVLVSIFVLVAVVAVLSVHACKKNKMKG